MSANQAASRQDDTARWVAQRNRDVLARGREAEAAGHAAYGAAVRSGATVSARRPTDVVSLGVQQLRAQKQVAPVRTSSPGQGEDLTELRRQQAEFARGVLEEDRRNRWMAVPALAPAAVVLGLEGLALAGGRTVAAEAALATPAGTDFPLYAVTRNRLGGNGFRDELVDLFRAEGREVRPEVTKSTPFGNRVVDIEVGPKENPLGGIEAKSGSSRYRPSQRAKDWYLKNVAKYPIHVVRDR